MAKNFSDFIEGVTRLVNKLNTFNLNGSTSKEHYKFVVEDKVVGYVLPNFIPILKEYEEVFSIQNDKLILNPNLKTSKERTDAVEKMLINLKSKNLISKLNGWRNEHFDVKEKFNEKSLFTIERSAVNMLGIRAYGCHINGYIKRNKQYFIWIAKRSPTKQTFPGMLDNFTAGGLTAGLSLIECARKELQEEAGLSEELTLKVKPIDAISYAYIDEGISIEAEFIFEIKLPLDFIPKNTDGEVEEFYLMSIPDVKNAIIREDFKPNSAVSTLSFLIKKGLVSPDEMPNYLEILEKIHMPGF